MEFLRSLKKPDVAAKLIVLASTFALLAAMVAQYYLGHKPCALCVYERFPYSFALLSYIFFRRHYMGPLLFILGTLFTIGTLLSFYHVGIEQLWWDPISTCNIDLEGLTIEELQQSALSKNLSDCRNITWTFLGLSIVFWNTLASLFLALYAFFVFRLWTKNT